MKDMKLPLAIVLACIVLVFCNKKGFKYEYHIEASYFLDDHYVVKFTRPFNFKGTLNRCFDISSPTLGEVYVVHQEIIFNDSASAVKFAKRFTSLEKCIRYNDSVSSAYDRMLSYRKQHPVLKNPQEIPKKPCCKTIPIY